MMETQIKKNMEHEMETLGPLKVAHRNITATVENLMEKNKEHEMETGVTKDLR